jgi:hypothetical protein
MTRHSINRAGTRVAVGVALGLLGLARAAQAQIEPHITGKPGEEHIRSRIGIAIQGGGGVTDFTGSGERNATNIGGSWDIRAVFGTRQIVAVEGAYVGSAHSISTPSATANTATLYGNGVEGDLRLNAPLLEREVLIEPFAFVGAGWAHYYFTNGYVVGANADSVGTIPMGGGLAIAYRGFLAEARFTYRSVYDDNEIVFRNPVGTAGLDNWNVGGMIGFEF